MKPQRFKIGQPVTPKVGSKWPILPISYMGIPSRELKTIPQMPRQGEIYHVSGYQPYDDGIWGIFLSEYGEDLTFNEEKFDPIELTNIHIQELIEESLTIKLAQ